MVKIIGVRFRTAGKVYYFSPGKTEPKAGDKVIVAVSYTHLTLPTIA